MREEAERAGENDGLLVINHNHGGPAELRWPQIKH